MAYPASTVFEKYSDLEGLGELLKNVPEGYASADQMQMLSKIRVTSDTIVIPGGPVGEITLRVVERQAPTLIRLEGVGTPVLGMSLHIVPLTPETCETYVQIDLQIPAIMKPMVNGPMQKMVDQFGQMMRQMPMQ
jgi:hypothetical protein